MLVLRVKWTNLVLASRTLVLKKFGSNLLSVKADLLSEVVSEDRLGLPEREKNEMMETKNASD